MHSYIHNYAYVCIFIFIKSYLVDISHLYFLYYMLYNFVKGGYIMTVLTYSNARKDFRKLIDKVNDDSDTVTITTNDRNAVLISEDDYNSIIETLYLQQSPVNAKRLAQSMEEAERVNTVEVDITTYE